MGRLTHCGGMLRSTGVTTELIAELIAPNNYHISDGLALFLYKTQQISLAVFDRSFNSGALTNLTLLQRERSIALETLSSNSRQPHVLVSLLESTKQ